MRLLNKAKAAISGGQEKQEKKVNEPTVKIDTYTKRIEGSGKRSHYALYASNGDMIGDTSGYIEVTPLAACDILTDEEMHLRRLNKLEILTRFAKLNTDINTLRDQQKELIVSLQKKGKHREAEVRRADYDDQIRKKIEDYNADQQRHLVGIDIGFRMAALVNAHLAKKGASRSDQFYRYSHNTMDRIINKQGWKIDKPL